MYLANWFCKDGCSRSVVIDVNMGHGSLSWSATLQAVMQQVMQISWALVPHFSLSPVPTIQKLAKIVLTQGSCCVRPMVKQHATGPSCLTRSSSCTQHLCGTNLPRERQALSVSTDTSPKHLCHALGMVLPIECLKNVYSQLTGCESWVLGGSCCEAGATVVFCRVTTLQALLQQ